VSVEDEVLAVSAAWAEALTSNDAPRVASFMIDDWVYIDPHGATPKADVIAWIASGHLVHHTMTVQGEARVVRAGDAVVVTARKTSSGISGGVAYTADEWISEVYARMDGRWRCVLSQKTPVSGGTPLPQSRTREA
jgi:uncharacterized protein (TIGR02246 family)